MSVTELDRQQHGAPFRQGARVASVVVGSPADRVRVPLGAIIVAVDGRLVTTPGDLAHRIAVLDPGREIELSYYYGGQHVRRRVVLADAARPTTRPPGASATSPGTAGGAASGIGGLPGGPIGGATSPAAGGTAGGPIGGPTSGPTSDTATAGSAASSGTSGIPGTLTDTPPAAAGSRSDQAALRAEIESLRREIDLLKRRIDELERNSSPK
jgi:hypothetical protein